MQGVLYTQGEVLWEILAMQEKGLLWQENTDLPVAGKIQVKN